MSSSFGSLNSQKGTPLVNSANSTMLHARIMTKSPSATVSEETYEESDARKKERMEAHQLRRTLEKIDQKDDEQRIHNAAKSEAADLVWKHQNPSLAEVEKTAAYRNPDLDQLKQGEFAHAMKPTRMVVAAMPDSRSASGGPMAPTNSQRQRLPWLRGGQKTETPTSLPQMNRAGPARETILQRGMRKVSGKRQVSSGSSKGVFRNPEDEIYEEPEESKPVVEPPLKQELPLRSCQTNSIPRGTRPLPEKSFTDPLLSSARLNRTEMHKSDPSQTQNAGYIFTRALPKTPIKEPEVELDDSPRYKDGIEIRSDDIRAATSMRKSDRSPNLPTPTAVSDRLGRPIVSFDPKWKPGSDSPRNSQDTERPRACKEDGSRSYPIQPEPDVPEITIMEDPRSPALQRETGAVPASSHQLTSQTPQRRGRHKCLYLRSIYRKKIRLSRQFLRSLLSQKYYQVDLYLQSIYQTAAAPADPFHLCIHNLHPLSYQLRGQQSPRRPHAFPGSPEHQHLSQA
ncbi:hypothetical protein LTR05_000302 [Lithohypha guttulata]|uniref:Uncharacterized protein n=1 Tax=Lithohypha guttulata TaxID=1690604 RepID=A0AAN7T4A6_9EURO|nr:hypothetical protein LTR05_000302 [Lithohypha guttulata]